MTDQARDVEAIFLATLERTTTTERQAYIDGACGNDAKLRSRVMELFQAHEASRGPLDAPPSDLLSATVANPVTEQPGTRIGPYKLLQKIGEGGMGVVFMAEQTEPVRRRVALKIIKPGMDTKQVIARFEAERQALALMDHPNIARVLDAGVTESERPYFVMDLVKGIPIHEYCDEHNLSTQERLELFIPVCLALQHAHHKGIVHRDVKPTNVLVAEFDNQAVPKIIDFGVAKAVDQQLTERTMFTQFGQVVGTPEYMSPEQAKLNQLDVDTRSDIYSLGVLLYELLTGVTPFDIQRLRSVAFDELLRIIREEEPPRPSVRLSTVEELPTVATKRRLEPGKLSLLLRGELDWIVMKAMDKERARRYDSASAFADDVQRYLRDDAVIARPPTRGYLLRKSAGRHKVAIGAAATVLLTLSIGIAGMSWMVVKVIRQKHLAMDAMRAAEAERAKLRDKLVEDAFLTVMAGDLENSETAIASAETAGASRATILALQGLAAFYAGDLEESLKLTREATEVDPQDFAAWGSRRMVYRSSGYLQMGYAMSTQMRSHGLDPDNGYRTDYERLMTVWGKDDIPKLDDLIERRPTWSIARVTRAYLLVQPPSSSAELDQAVRDIATASEVLPRTPYVLAAELAVHSAVVKHSSESGSLASNSRELADSNVQELNRYPDFLPGCVARMMYFRTTGQRDQAEEELRRVRDLGWGGRWTKAIDCYRIGDNDSAKQILREEPYMFAQMWLAMILADDSREDALAAYRNFMRREDLHTPHRRNAITILLLVGQPTDVIRAEVRREFPDPRERDHHLEFTLGNIDEEKYLANMTTYWWRQAAHYRIAMGHISRGEREEARSHFEQAVKDFLPGWPACHWSEAFLERLESDPDWPARIQQPAKRDTQSEH